MKTILALLAVGMAFGLAAPSTASAYDDCHRRVAGYRACGHPIYSVYEVCGYDRFGRPYGRWVTQPHVCGPRYFGHMSHGRHSHHRHHHSSRHHHRSHRSGFSVFIGR